MFYKIVALIITALLPGCTFPNLVSVTPATPVAQVDLPFLVQVPADASPTLTPFLPLEPTATYLPTEYPTPKPTPKPTRGFSKAVQKSWGDYPGPTIWPDIDVPPPTGILAQPLGQLNILLLGSDQRPYEGGLRTDTILLVTLNPSKNTVNITSFPRDLYVYIPGYTINRINTAYYFGGFDLLALTIEYNFGVYPDHYALINFSSFTRVIDDLGGIDVDVAVSLTDHRDGYGNYTMRAGRVHMDGETALWYVRSRYSTSDFDRGRRQQEVLLGIFYRLMNLDVVAKAPQFYKLYKNDVVTDLKLDNIKPFLPMAAHVIEGTQIKNYFIGPQQVTSWVNSYGAMVLIPIREPVLQVMRKALNCPK